MAADHHLLFGLLALQTGLIDQAELFAGFHAWTRNKTRPLAEHLVALGHLDATGCAAVEAVARAHLEKQKGDVEKSLLAVPSRRSTRAGLAQIRDAEITESVGRHSLAPIYADGERTASYPLSAATSVGQRFRIVRPHARGGLGAVFVALDAELNREVALKQILEQHVDDGDCRRRFLLEAEITGGLEHPGIVPVYGLGTDEGGHPFYAMRFIRGESLKEAIDRFHQRNKPEAGNSIVAGSDALAPGEASAGSGELELRKLLRRFIDVCNVIGYAHARGILHRDLKPANIVLGKYGETLVVDWGLAKPLGASSSASEGGERTLMPTMAGGSAETIPGTALGTAAYMSPEQAGGEHERIGPLSDVYSLGATLYCLLTGKAPFAGERIDVLRKVTRGELTPPRYQKPSIDRALEAICLKAMAMNPEHRYTMCRALADDIDRWMADEPVAAYREPLKRRVRRWARRNRTLTVSAAAALVVSVLGLSALAAEQARSNAALAQAKSKIQQALDETSDAQKKTKAALEESETSRNQADAVGKFLVNALTKADPYIDSKDVKVVDVLNHAAAELANEFSGPKPIEGALWQAVEQTYYGLGLLPKAEEAVRKALAIREAALGPDHPDTLDSRTDLGVIAWGRGRVAEAITILEATLKVYEEKYGESHPGAIMARVNLAVAYQDAGQAARAIPLLKSALSLEESRLGPDHNETLVVCTNLARAYAEAARFSEAIELYESASKRWDSTRGADYLENLVCKNGLALVYMESGRIDKAIALFESTARIEESKFGRDYPATLQIRSNLASAYGVAGRQAEAIALYEETAKLREQKLGADHPHTLKTRNGLASACLAVGRLADAEAIARETLRRRRRREKPGDILLSDDLDILGQTLLRQGRYSEAEPILRECLAIRRKEAPDSPERFHAESMLGEALFAQGKFALAEPLVVGGYQGMKDREGTIPAQRKFFLSGGRDRVVRLYKLWGKADQAAVWAARLGLLDLPDDVFARP